MKTTTKYLTVILILFTLVSASFGKDLYDVIWQWDANTEEDLAGYRFYRSRFSNMSGAVKVGEVGKITTVTVKNYSTATMYYNAATAYNTTNQESGYSNIVSITLPSKVTNVMTRLEPEQQQGTVRYMTIKPRPAPKPMQRYR